MADDSYDTPEKKTNDILETNDIVDKIDHKPPQITSLKTPNDNESDRSKGSVGPSPVKSFLSTPSVNTSQTLLTRETTARKLDRYLTAKDAAKAMSIAFVNVCAHVPIAPNSKETKQILFDVSGTINSGELVALMVCKICELVCFLFLIFYLFALLANFNFLVSLHFGWIQTAFFRNFLCLF